MSKLVTSNDESLAIQLNLREVPEQLEVSFTVERNLPRGSSLSFTNQKPEFAQKKTSCFVHGLLRDDRLHEPVVLPELQSEAHHGSDKEPNAGLTALTRSHLLKRNELAEVTFSIRELSHRLARFRLKLKVQNIFILTKAHDESLVEVTHGLAQWLLSGDSGGKYTVYVEDKLRSHASFQLNDLPPSKALEEHRLKFWTAEMCTQQPHLFDIIISLGGDGTVLYASWLFQKVVPPVLSFSLGSLGFLTKFDFDSHRTILRDAFEHGITVNLRVRLEATIMRSQCSGKSGNDLVGQLVGEQSGQEDTHQPEQSHEILNDLVTDRGPNPTMSAVEVFGNDFFIGTIQADGVCIATPTGSTAYNLAAGGSLCHPDNPVVLLTAICAHTLSFRPIVIPDHVVLRLGVPYDARTSSWVSFDGKSRVELRAGDYVTVSASRFPFPTVMPPGRGGEDWIESLSETLNWNSRQKQKAFT